MRDKIYKLMNWPAIEGIIYTEEGHPKNILGGHSCSGGILYQTFLPGIKEACLVSKLKNKTYPMELADEEGFFACILSEKELEHYKLQYVNQDGKKIERYDAYTFDVLMTEEEQTKWNTGTMTNAYDYLGSHVTKIDNIAGTIFRVWAPNAVSVSVMGDFNDWDERCYPMEKNTETGIFSIFIPEVKELDQYQYVVRTEKSEKLIKSDPYTRRFDKTGKISIVTKESDYKWNDSSYINRKEAFNTDSDPLSVYYLNIKDILSNVMQDRKDKMDHFIQYVKEMKYTHIQMESVCKGMDGAALNSNYAIDDSILSEEELKYLVDGLHGEGINIIMDWIPAYFHKNETGLCYFDGTYLYGHLDERMRYSAAYDGFLYNYKRPQVQNYLQSNALYFVRKYHLDGLHIGGLSSILYLDYGKSDGQWVANLYGGNENLDAIEFIKNVNILLHKENKNIITTTKETSAWPKITDTIANEGLGFDYVWNNGFFEDVLEYMKCPIKERMSKLELLTNNMAYAYCENYIIPLSNYGMAQALDSIYDRLPTKDIDSNLRLLLTFCMAHPGKKLTSSQFIERDINLKNFEHTLNRFYLELPALYKEDRNMSGFEWIQCINHGDGIIAFLRKSEYLDQTILVVCNFSDKNYTSYKLGVPFEGKYKEIFLSEDKEYGGTKKLINRYKVTKEEDYDGKKNSLSVRIPPLSVSYYQYKPYSEEELLKIAEKKVESIKLKLEKEAIKKASLLKKMTLKEELEKKVVEADKKISNGKERESKPCRYLHK